MSTDLDHLDHLGWLVKRVQHGHHRALDTNLAALGVTLVQWNALREIERHPGCSLHQLAEHTFNSDQAIGTLVARLQARGLVERRPGVGRATIHRLTAKGRALLRDGQAVMSSVLATSFAPLGARDRADLARLLTRILDARP